MNRRRFIQQSAMGAGLALNSSPFRAESALEFPVVRTAAGKRNFTSTSVEQTIERMHKTIAILNWPGSLKLLSQYA